MVDQDQRVRGREQHIGPEGNGRLLGLGELGHAAALHRLEQDVDRIFRWRAARFLRGEGCHRTRDAGRDLDRNRRHPIMD